MGICLTVLWALSRELGSWVKGGEGGTWGAQVSLVHSPALPRALLAEFFLASPLSLHASFLSTLASPSEGLMNNDRPVIRLTSEPSLS